MNEIEKALTAAFWGMPVAVTEASVMAQRLAAEPVFKQLLASIWDTAYEVGLEDGYLYGTPCPDGRTINPYREDNNG